MNDIYIYIDYLNWKILYILNINNITLLLEYTFILLYYNLISS